jgi:hypothetical protein
MAEQPPSWGAEIVRFPAPKSCHAGDKAAPQPCRKRDDASERGGTPLGLPDPEYWLRKAEDFRRAALSASRNEEAAILIRRAEEFARMAEIMAVERTGLSPLPRAAGKKAGAGAAALLRAIARGLRRQPGLLSRFELPVSSPPTAAAPRGPIARRAQRLAWPANDSAPPPAAPRPVIARRARRLAR